MRVSDFDYHLPEAAIAQRPVEPRDASRLLVLDRRDGRLLHRVFRDLPEFLLPGDLLVVNDSRVMPARLFGVKERTGGSVELLLLERRSLDTWEVLAKPARRLRPGTRISFGEGLLRGEVIEERPSGGRVITFRWEGVFEDILRRLGQMPLPPYIKERLDDPERYQTVYARQEGSKAAPTAGLHFTEELLETLRRRGIEIVPVTLHVGLGTFRPVTAEVIEEHEMHAEFYRIPEETAASIARAKERGARCVAVGTTVVRALESAAGEEGRVRAQEGWTDIFIYPGYRFRVVDAMVTNFHLPRSTLLMLVSAFAGRERVLAAYREALTQGYRFFSFGDAMLIL